MWWKWLPWRYLISKGAKSGGFLDPVTLAAKLSRFSQPSEVSEPIELLRAGVVFHARGLVNTKAIQHNLDWVWPYWVERQFDPLDLSFLPRAFSITHVNLTHRNWTAVGIPGCEHMPIVDPRGLITPHFDGWSVDTWLLDSSFKPALLPSRLHAASQTLRWLVEDSDSLAVDTIVEDQGLRLDSSAEVELYAGSPVLRVKVRHEPGSTLAVGIRPYNPEGICFIHDIQLSKDRAYLTINSDQRIVLPKRDFKILLSNYRTGDVVHKLAENEGATSIHCEVGLASAALVFMDTKEEQTEIRFPLEKHQAPPAYPTRLQSWKESLQPVQAKLPDPLFEYLFECSHRSIVLLTPDDAYPGPYTYKRFWFRDAAFLLHSLLTLGYFDLVEHSLHKFPGRQTRNGYMRSQEGEWDSNGEVLWTFKKYCDLSGRPPHGAWRDCIRRAGIWIIDKRMKEDRTSPHAGLLPAGFSAEHLGPNDYYYWDDFWGWAGLLAAAELMAKYGDKSQSAMFLHEAESFARDINRSIEGAMAALPQRAIPASPHRRMDSGAIGSLAAGYPLGLYAEDYQPLLGTVNFLRERCLVREGFFQDMIHSGINAYLTLHMAQVLLRAGDRSFFPLVQAVAELASPTGQWPEAIHPHTLGGCMGDGHHGWASAEWLMMIKNMLIRDEDRGVTLCGGVPEEWLAPGKRISFGPVQTRFGALSVEVQCTEEQINVRWDGRWRGAPPNITVDIAGREPVSAKGSGNSMEFAR